MATVLITGPNQAELQHTLEPGAGMLIGSDQTCDVVLESPSVAARHCMLQLNGDSLSVTDWYSATGTLVNGEKIYAETRLGERDKLTVGPYTFKFQLKCFDACEEVEITEEPKSGSLVVDSKSSVNEPAGEVLPFSPSGNLTMIALQKQLDEALAKTGCLARELEFQKSLASIKEANDSPYEDFDESESEILRAEIEHLQAELSQRESEIEELLARDHAAAPQTDTLGESDTARLVTRLEQLLDELQHSDERVRSLENLLQISEEATVAEHAEREQLSGWVSEIESRVADREQQWRSSQERLEESLREATRRYERAEGNVRRVAESNVQELQRDLQNQIMELNDRNTKLNDELSAVKSEHAALAELISQTGMSRSDIEALNVRQSEMRQHEIQLAQDRALVARQRAEIASLREELDKANSGPAVVSMDNPDQRIRQFRAHLREIHESELEEKRQRSLGGRISRLFKRLDEK